MKATAIDAKTGVEVSVAGPATGSRELLKRTALNKLRRAEKIAAPVTLWPMGAACACSSSNE